MAYGLKINSFEDDVGFCLFAEGSDLLMSRQLMTFADRAAVIFGEAAQPGGFLVDTFPACP
jgi:hypothetical protein